VATGLISVFLGRMAVFVVYLRLKGIMHHRIRHRALAILFLAFSSAPAWAITDYYTAPQNDPVTGLSTGTSFSSTPTLSSANGVAIASSASAGGWNYEGLFAGVYTATAIAPGWIATVSHIGSSGTYVYNGVSYNVVPNSGVVINPASDGSGIELYRIAGTLPTYAQIWSSTDGDENHSQAVLTGRGFDKGAPIFAQTTAGDPFQQGQQEGWAEGANNATLTWGENYVYPLSLGTTPYLAYSFDAPGAGDSTTNEADLIVGDSGGGVYLYSPVTKTWKLAGLNEGIVNGGPYSTTSDFANPFIANLYDTQGLYTAPGTEVKSPSVIGNYYTSTFQPVQVSTVGEIDVSYDVGSEATLIAAAEDFLNTSGYTLGLTKTVLVFNSSNTTTTLGAISGNNTISTGAEFDNNFIFTVPAGSTFTFSATAQFVNGSTLGSNGPGVLQMKNVRSAGLTITNGTVQILSSGTASSVSILNSLSISSGGKLDLNNNDLIVNSLGADLTSTIRSYLVSSYDHSLWDLTGIGSSMAGTSGKLKTLGYADNSLLGLSTFDNQTVTSSSVLVKYTYVGDANLDGVVNGTDLAMMAANGTSWMQGDFNYDGVVNADDYALFMLGNAGQGSPIRPAPEPAGAVVIAGTIVLSSRRRRR
jgi:hypothetical protein